MADPILTPSPAERVIRRRTRRDPHPRFKVETVNQLDAVRGCPEMMVEEKHSARQVKDLVAKLDLSEIEKGYSSLGRRGYHPRSLLAVWVYASWLGIHHASKVAVRLKTDIAFQFLSGGHAYSPATLKRFRAANSEFFEKAIAETVRIATGLGFLDSKALAVDSVRIRAHASLSAVRTVSRSQERLEELEKADVTSLSEKERVTHHEKVQKHKQALSECEQQGRTNIVLTNPEAALMKFPSGASAPGHRATVVSSGSKARMVVGVIIDASATDWGKLEGAVKKVREVLTGCGLPDDLPLQLAADSGYYSEADLRFAHQVRPHTDILIKEITHSRHNPKKGNGKFSREDFTLLADGTMQCPAGKPMNGPGTDGPGKRRWSGIGCDKCKLKSRCTDGKTRVITRRETLEDLKQEMRERMKAPGAVERYNQRIATIEPVFSNIEDNMSFRRASSRFAQTIKAEILLKLLAHNLQRLAKLKPGSFFVCLVEIEF